MQDILQKSEHFRLRVHRKARSHYLAAKRASRMHTVFGVPVVVLSTIVGSSIFATLSNNPSAFWKISAGLLSITAAVLAALLTFFKFSEMAEKHRISGAEYASLKRKIDLLQLRINEPLGNREEFIGKLQEISNLIDNLEKDSPDLPDVFYDQAVKEQQTDEEGV